MALWHAVLLGLPVALKGCSLVVRLRVIKTLHLLSFMVIFNDILVFIADRISYLNLVHCHVSAVILLALL